MSDEETVTLTKAEYELLMEERLAKKKREAAQRVAQDEWQKEADRVKAMTPQEFHEEMERLSRMGSTVSLAKEQPLR